MASARRLGGLAVAAVLLAACSGGSAEPTLPVPPGAVIVRAVGSAFQPAQITVSGVRPFVLYFDNADGFPHNVAAVAPDGSRVLNGEVFNGPAQRAYEMPSLLPGTYTLLCDVHPGMTATLVVP